MIDVDLGKVTKVLFGDEWWDVHPGTLSIDELAFTGEGAVPAGEVEGRLAFRFVGSSLGESRAKGRVTGVLAALQAVIE